MKITAIETLRTREFSNVLWARVHTDTGITGLGETFYGAGAVEAHLHDTPAGRLLGRNPLDIEALHREMLNLPMAQSSTGVEYRAASAVDIALWDVFGKVCGQPVHQMLGGLCRPKQRIYCRSAMPSCFRRLLPHVLQRDCGDGRRLHGRVRLGHAHDRVELPVQAVGAFG